MLGYFIGGIVTIWLSVKGVHFKYLFAAGFLLLGLSAMFMYFEVQGAGLYERMKYPVIIRSTGMMLLYSLIPTFATQRMPYKFLSSWICTMLTVRINMAAISTKGRIQVQATLSAVKEMAGWTLYACLICMIFAVVIPYPKRKLLT